MANTKLCAFYTLSMRFLYADSVHWRCQVEETGRGINEIRGERRSVSYLLRLWQAGSGGKLVWRASLESPQTGERRGFPSLIDLLIFLEEEYGAVGEDRSGPLAGAGGA